MQGEVHWSVIYARQNWKPCKCLATIDSKVNMMYQFEVTMRKSTKWKHRKMETVIWEYWYYSCFFSFFQCLLNKCHYDNDKNV